MSGAFAAYGLTVTPANVLGLRRVILTEADELRTALKLFKLRHSDGMPVLGGDPVSPYAAVGFTACIDAYLAQCQARIDELDRLGAQLAAAAREYGKAESEIAASSQPGVRHDASPLVRPPVPAGGVLGSYPDALHPAGGAW